MDSPHAPPNLQCRPRPLYSNDGMWAVACRRYSGPHVIDVRSFIPVVNGLLRLSSLTTAGLDEQSFLRDQTFKRPGGRWPLATLLFKDPPHMFPAKKVP
jgi:hypothetical protein